MSSECEACLAELQKSPPSAAPLPGQSTVIMDGPPPQRPQAQPGPKPMTVSGPELRAGPDQRTIAIGMSAPAMPQGQRTMAIPDSEGVVAFAMDEARRAQAAAVVPAPPAGPLFWFAWIIFGVAAGLGIHMFVVPKL
jgi:hypothetical protein